jgi:ABC-type multidrug transport system fused ATPase/permease subunit
LVISGARIVEDGSPAELIRARGPFYQLFRRELEEASAKPVEAQA